MGGNEAAPFLTEPLTEFRIAGQMEDPLGEGVKIAGFHEEPGDVVATNFGRSIQVECYHRPSGGHCLGQGAREPFAAGEMHKHIHEGKVTGNLSGRDEPDEAEMACQAKVPDSGLEPVAPGPITDEQKTDMGTAGDDIRGDGEKIVMAFECEQARDFSDDEVGGIEVETRAEGGIGLSLKIRFEIKAAVNSGILVRLPDAGVQVLVDHGIGDRDEMGGDAGGELFGVAEREVGKSPLERPKRRTMDGMDNDWHAGTTGRQSPEETGLAAVGMDDMGIEELKVAGQIEESAQIKPGLDGPDERGNEVEREGGGGCPGFE
jgi:hypothetical protein